MSKYDLKSLLNTLDEKEKSNEGGNSNRSEFWKPTIEKGEDKVEYIIRFLPNPDSKDGFPYIERCAHMFNFPSGKFVYEPCPKKGKNEPCPMCEEVSKLYATGDENKKAIGGKRFAKQRWYHNVLIVKDPRDGGKNEGKVLMFECGQQVLDKCQAFLKNSEIPAEERIYFHPTQGTNFKLTVAWKQNYPNYDQSEFSRKTSPIEVDGAELSLEDAEAFVDENAHKLNERLFGEKTFKSYDMLKEIWDNQGVVESKKSSKSESKEEEIEEDLDETINGDTIETRNPSKDERVSNDVDETSSLVEDDVDEDDEDAELAALLA